MEYPPQQWECFNAEEFNTAQPRSAGELGAELLVQVRPNGRMLDHFRVAVGGNKILQINAAMADVLQIPSAKTWRLKMQLWPRDLDVKRNMTSTAWLDVVTLIASNTAKVVSAGENGEEAAIESSVVLDEIKQAEVGAAVRFMVAVGGDQKLALVLQGLPATADYLMGRPAFRG
jgi:hypothetical protein